MIKSLNFVQNLPKLKLQLLSRFTFVVFLFSTFNLFSQSLILNEVSQGPSGSKEYIELLVIPGISPYNCTNYCLDLRNWVLDDNNGYFSGGPTSGVGIANGAVRFKNDPFWQCIPIGTLIVIYNDLDQNASLPANDISITDGNCSIVIPVTSSLLEHQTTSPTPSASSYPSSGWITGGLWVPISMANGTFSTGVFTNGDSFQVYNPSNLTTPIHGVSWANNNDNNIIYFNSLATNSVFYFGNTIDNNPSIQANWISGTCSAPDNQTPGLPNNPANATYISSLNNNCAGPLVVTLIGSTDASSCLCNGQSSVNASGSIPGYTYSWYNSSFVSIGQNTASATNLCAGTYYCIVSSSINCTDTLLVTINNTVTSITPTFNPIAPICAGGTINLPTTSTNGITGSWSPAVNNTQTTTYTFTPTGGQCATTTTLQVSVGAPQTPTFATVGPYCAGASFSLPNSSTEGFTGSWSPAINTTTTTSYSFTPTSGQCATTANLSVTINPIPTVSILENPTICAGQSTVLTTSTSIPGGSFAWNPGGQTTSTVTVNPTSSTTYSVVYSVSGCASLPASSSVTVNNSIIPQFASWGPFCQDALLAQVILPETSINGITGSWNPQMVSTATAGISTYTFTPTAGQCASDFQLLVEVFATPIIFGGNDITICAGNSITLSATGGAQYTWSNSVQNGIPFQAISSSVYTVSAIDANGCEGFDTVNITVLESPIAAFAPDVTTGIAPLTVQFINTSTNTTSYLWDFGNGNTLAVSNTNTVETTYLSAQSYEVWLVASNGFCADSALATIIVLPAGAPEIVIPNVFTPNGDVTNDEWIIQTTNIASIEIVILNRWGNVMAEITDLVNGWNGKTTNGDDATDGTYFYKYTAKALNGENLSGHGFLTLIR